MVQHIAPFPSTLSICAACAKAVPTVKLYCAEWIGLFRRVRANGSCLAAPLAPEARVRDSGVLVVRLGEYCM